jgi:hypothetical protein
MTGAAPDPGWYYFCGGAAGHSWHLGSGWQDNAAMLYDIAEQVVKKAGAARNGFA